jgi:hypothetical protein
MKPDRLRSANRPMMYTGTTHSGVPPSTKPWSSSLRSMSEIIGSVTAVTTAPRAAASRPQRLLRT